MYGRCHHPQALIGGTGGKDVCEAARSWRGGEGGVIAIHCRGFLAMAIVIIMVALCDVAVFNLTSYIAKQGWIWQCKSAEPKGFPVTTSLRKCKSPLYSPERHSIEYNGLIWAVPSIAMFVKEHERGIALQICWRKFTQVSKVGVGSKDTVLVILNNLSHHCTPY